MLWSVNTTSLIQKGVSDDNERVIMTRPILYSEDKRCTTNITHKNIIQVNKYFVNIKMKNKKPHLLWEAMWSNARTYFI